MSPKRHRDTGLGGVLKGLRSRAGLTLRAVAEISQSLPEPIAFDYLSRVEAGQITPGPEKLLTLATIYEVPGQAFLDAIELAAYERFAPSTNDFAECAARGLAAGKQGDFRAAYAALLRARLLLQKRTDLPEAERREQGWQIRNDFSVTLFRLGKPRLAQREAEELLSEAGLPPRLECRALNLISLIHHSLGHYQLAEAVAYSAVRSARRLKEPAQLIQALINLSNPRFETGRRRLAAQGYRRALALSEPLQPGQEMVSALVNLGSCEHTFGHTEEAEQHLRQGLALARTIQNSRLETWGLIELGRLLAAESREHEAREAFMAARQTAVASNHLAFTFHSTYHLWRLALRAGMGSAAVGLFKALRKMRLQVDQRTEEVVSFDAYVEEARARSRSKGARREHPHSDSEPHSGSGADP